MNISERIEEVKIKFIMDHGKNPTVVYLGRAEMNLMLDWAEENQYITSARFQLLENDHRPEINGLPVFKVNADFHLGFGII